MRNRLPNALKDIKEKGKKYLKGNVLLRGILLILFIVIFLFGLPFMNSFTIILYVFTAILIGALLTGAIFSRFNGQYYIEYQKWKAFKRYLKNSFSIKTATHKTVVIWNEYLIYATALGVPDKIIKELRANNIINENQNRMYTGITNGMFFNLGALSASVSGMGGGGFGGAGGGGVGGGGGGGR